MLNESGSVFISQYRIGTGVYARRRRRNTIETPATIKIPDPRSPAPPAPQLAHV
jgi:hypothetical protein